MIQRRLSKLFAKPEGIAGSISTKFMNVMNQSIYRDVVSIIPKDYTLPIGDIGYGNGFVLRQLLKKGYKNLYGVEVSASMHQKVNRDLKADIAFERLQLVLANIEELPFQQHTFGVLYSINTLYFWSSLDAGFAEINRVLDDDGYCIIGFYDKRWLKKFKYFTMGFHIYETQEIEISMKQHGLHIMQVITHHKGKTLCYVCKKRR